MEVMINFKDFSRILVGKREKSYQEDVYMYKRMILK